MVAASAKHNCNDAHNVTTFLALCFPFFIIIIIIIIIIVIFIIISTL